MGSEGGGFLQALKGRLMRGGWQTTVNDLGEETKDPAEIGYPSLPATENIPRKVFVWIEFDRLFDLIADFF